MYRGTKAKKIAAVAMMCSCLMSVRSAQAFVWPVIDLTEIVSFVNSISTGLNQITNAKSQVDNVTNVIKVVGDQVSSVKKYAADLTGTITNIKDSVSKVTANIGQAANDAASIAGDANEMLNNSSQTEKDNAENTEQNVNEQVDNGASEEEVQGTLDEGRKESEKNRDAVNETLDKASDTINDSLDKANQALDMLVDTINSNEGLNEEQRTGYRQDADEIKDKMDALKSKATDVIATAKENYNEEYSAKVAAAFDAYSQAVSDYYAGKITRDDLSKAGEEFKSGVASLDVGIDNSAIDGMVSSSKDIADEIDALKENMLNDISNSGDYSDEEEVSSLSEGMFPASQDSPIDNHIGLRQKRAAKYVFNFSSARTNALLTGIYADEADKSFLLSNELKCDKMGDISEIEKDPSGFRECVVKAKTEKELYPNAFDEELYKKFKKNGVYKHIIEDYSIANIVGISKAKQFAATWGSLEPDDDSNKGTYYVLRKTLKDVDNTRNAFILMGMADIEAPKLWSEIRRIDALDRSKSMVQNFELGTTLYLDGRDAEFMAATKDNRGTMKADDLDAKENEKVKGKVIFSNVILYTCGLRAKDISVSEVNKTNSSDIAKKEQNLADCLYKYAEGASRGTINGASTGDPEATKKEWREKQTKAYNDSAFNNLTLAVINNYKSSLDYMDPKKLPDPDKDKNIVSMQDGLKESTTTKDDYASGAQINYYTTQQILSIVDGDAQNQQTEILKDLRTFNYNYFGRKG